MKRQIILIISVIISTILCAQTNSITIRKPLNDSINIIGTWTPVFDKDAKGKTSEIAREEIDTLTFYPNKKYLKQQKGQEVGIWSVDHKNQIINYKNGIFTCTIDREVIEIDNGDSWERLGTVSKDTITFIRALEERVNTGYKTRYYIRKK